MKSDSSNYPRRIIHYDASDEAGPLQEPGLETTSRVLERAKELQRINVQLTTKINELIGTQQQLVQAEKMALAGKLSGAIAHEVNNPLSVLCSSLELLKETIVGLEKLWSEVGDLTPAQKNRFEREATSSMQESGELINDALVSAQRLGELVAGLTKVANPIRPAAHGKADLAKIAKEVFPNSTTGSQECLVDSDPLELTENIRKLAGCFKTPGGVDFAKLRVSVNLGEDGPTLVLSDREIVLSDAQRRSLFDPALEKDESGETIRLNLALAETYFWLRELGAEMIQEGEPGLVIRVLFPPWKET